MNPDETMIKPELVIASFEISEGESDVHGDQDAKHAKSRNPQDSRKHNHCDVLCDSTVEAGRTANDGTKS